MELRAGGGVPSGASAHKRVAVPWEFHPSCASAPTMELRPGEGGPSGATAPAHRWAAAPSEELHRARSSATSTNFRPLGGEPSGPQLLTMEQLKRPHAARLAEVLHAPAITMGRIPRQELYPKSLLYNYKNSCSGRNHVKSCAPPLAPTAELRSRGSRSGVQLLMLELQKGFSAACLAEGFRVPPATMGSLTCLTHRPMPKATMVCKRTLSSAAGPVPPLLSAAGPVPPLSSAAGPVPPPPGWDGPFFDEPPLRRSGPPGFLEPDFSKSIKTLRPVVPEVCIDESTYLANYEPLDYIKRLPLVRNKVIYGVQPDASGVQPSVLLPADGALRLMRSLPLLARFFHEQHCCLPRITLKDLVVSGDGQFRLRGCDVVPREFSVENVCDVHANINELLEKMLPSYGLPGDYPDLKYQLANYGAPDTSEYLICFNAFFIPLGNKGSALFRFIDYILQLPQGGDALNEALDDLPYMERDVNGRREWVNLALRNSYLNQWMQYRQYADGRLEFLRFVRAVLCHKLKYGLTDKFVDFLIYATYPRLLCTLQYNLWNCRVLKNFQLEELFPKDLASDFPEFLV